MRRPWRGATVAAVVGVLAVSAAPAGSASDQPGASGPGDESGNSHHSLVFPKTARPYGADMTTWAERAVQWIYAQPYEQNPAFDQTGVHCAMGQQGPVWFIPPIFVPPGTPRPIIQDASRTCTIPAHKPILLDIGALTLPYPCPDESFAPAPGQSLYDFLIDIAGPIMDSVDFLEVTIDGRDIPDVLSYRFGSDDLFQLTGHPSLQSRLDDCITGHPQPAVTDGFFMMIKPLASGVHRVVVHGTNTFGDDRTYTYHLTVV